MKDSDKGIWIDEEKAWIIYKKNGRVKLKQIISNVDTYHLRGGSPSTTPYGPKDAISETNLLRRKKQQLKRYFRKIIQELRTAERVHIIGPAEAKEGLEKELLSKKGLPFESVVVETADSMTQNQFKARVRDFFAVYTT